MISEITIMVSRRPNIFIGLLYIPEVWEAL